MTDETATTESQPEPESQREPEPTLGELVAEADLGPGVRVPSPLGTEEFWWRHEDPPAVQSRPSGVAPILGGRREAREQAFLLLYEVESTGGGADAAIAAQVIPPDEYTIEVVRGVCEQRAELDRLIGGYTGKWPVDRLATLDRIVLRLAAFELCHRPEVPTTAVLAEAVELADRYSTDESPRFINGVLAAIAADIRPE